MAPPPSNVFASHIVVDRISPLNPLVSSLTSCQSPSTWHSAASSSSLGSKTCQSALPVTVVTPPQGVKLTEVHVGWHSARFVRLSCLAASLPEEAPVSGAGTGALRLGVGGLQCGCGTLATGNTEGKRTGEWGSITGCIAHGGAVVIFRKSAYHGLKHIKNKGTHVSAGQQDLVRAFMFSSLQY